MFKRTKNKFFTLSVVLLFSMPVFSSITPPSYPAVISLPAIVPGGSSHLFKLYLERLASHLRYDIYCHYNILDVITLIERPLDIYVKNNMPYPLNIGGNEVAANTALPVMVNTASGVILFSLKTDEHTQMQTFSISNVDTFGTSMHVDVCGAVSHG